MSKRFALRSDETMHTPSKTNYLRRTCKRTVVAMVGFAMSCAGSAADLTHYPSKPLRLLAPATPGEPGDAVARAVGGALSNQLGRYVAVENHPGMFGIDATENAARAEPDGYTLTLGSTTTHVLAPLALEVGYDSEQDFDPVTQVALMPYVVATPASMKSVSIAQLVALSKSHERPLRYSSLGDPLGDLGIEMLKNVSGLNVRHSVHSSNALFEAFLRRPQPEIIFARAGAVLSHVNTGRWRAIAVSTTKRVAILPGVPTVAEAGYAGLDVAEWFAIFVPRGTPAEIIHRLHVELANATLTDGVKRALGRTGAEPFANVSNLDVLRAIREDSAKYGKAVSQMNFKPTRTGKPEPGPVKH